MQYLIVGAKFRPPARALLDTLALGTKLWARRESTNQYDPNAIQVLVRSGDFKTNSAMALAVQDYGRSIEEIQQAAEWHLGYIPREHASSLAPAMDAAQTPELVGSLTFSATGLPQIRLNGVADVS